MARLRHPQGSNAGMLSRKGELFSGGPAEGFLQKYHPGARLIFLIILLGGISLCSNSVMLAGFFALSMATAVAAFLNLQSIYRVMLVPLMLMAVPSWLVAVWWYNISFSSGIPFFLRTLASVSIASVVLHSIGLRHIGEILAWLRLPTELRQSWTMMVSQVAAFSELITEMAFARSARRVQPAKGSLIRRQIGIQMGILFARTYQRGNQLGLALESRHICQQNPAPVTGFKNSWTSSDHGMVGFALAVALVSILL